jgi:hypothetical protein
MSVNSADRLISRAFSNNVNRSDIREAYALLLCQVISAGSLVADEPNYAQAVIDVVMQFDQSAATTDFAQRFRATARQLAQGN